MPLYGLKFRTLGQTCYYSGPDTLRPGDQVIIAAEQGEALAEVVSGPHESLPAPYADAAQDILRPATAEDKERARSNAVLAQEAAAFCRQCIRQRRLDMKLVEVEVYFDRSKFIFYFTAPARIDFRELVKDLVREYRARIELRQIGVRHETQMVGAVGNCGMVCCCRRYLRKFAPVTIRMAKEQNLFLNPAKISGICGRLLCCLAYEQENYDRFHRHCPRLGKKYQTTQGSMKVLRANMFRNSLSVLNENNEELELTLEEWQALDPHRPEAPQQQQAAGQGKAQARPAASPAADGMLIVSATPDTIDDDLSRFHDLLPEAGDSADGMAASAAQPAAGQGEGGKARRKRRRKPAARSADDDGPSTEQP